MFQRLRYVSLIFGIWVITLLPSFYYLYQQANEENIIEAYLVDNKLTEMSLSKESAIKVADQVRSDFNTERSTFKALDLNNRPFLREDTKLLLTYREGVCGEGTRVLVNLLQKIGYDATRITLYNKVLSPSHTLVSIKLDNMEFLLDSINSSERINSFLRNNNISTADFDLLHYNSSIRVRDTFTLRQRNKEPPTDPLQRKFFTQFWLYSYEATPYAKLLTGIGLDIRVFNFDRPSKTISILAEKPNMLMAIVSFLASLIVMIILFASRFLKKSYRVLTK